MGRIVVVRHALPDSYKFTDGRKGAEPPWKLFSDVVGRTYEPESMPGGKTAEGLELQLGPQGKVMIGILGKMLAADSTDPTFIATSNYLRALETGSYLASAISPEAMDSASAKVLDDVMPGGTAKPFLDALCDAGEKHHTALVAGHDSHPGELLHRILYGHAEEIVPEFKQKYSLIPDSVHPFEVATCCGYQIDFEGGLKDLPALIGKPDAFTVKKLFPHKEMADTLSDMAGVIREGKPNYLASYERTAQGLEHCATLFRDVSLEQAIIHQVFKLPSPSTNSMNTPLISNIAQASEYIQQVAKLDDDTLRRNNVPASAVETARTLTESGRLDTLLEYMEVKDLSLADIKRGVTRYLNQRGGPE